MPILFALYRVIYSMPAYVGKIKDAFTVLAEKIISVDNGAFLQNSEVETVKQTVMMYGQNIKEGNMVNGVIDVLNRLSTADMNLISEHYGLADLTHNGELILSNDVTRGLIDTYNNFLGLNMGNSPSYIIKDAFAAGAWLVIIGAIMIPVLSAVTQWLNVKLMPQQENRDKKTEENTMVQSMNTMNKIMPLMSAWFCFTLPCGMGLYWIAGSVVRSIQQVVINKYFDKMDFDKLISENSAKSKKKMEKNAKRMEKLQQQQELMNQYSAMKTKNIQSKANTSTGVSAKEAANATKNPSTSSTPAAKAKPGSMMEKANMVRQYNERNSNR